MLRNKSGKMQDMTKVFLGMGGLLIIVVLLIAPTSPFNITGAPAAEPVGPAPGEPAVLDECASNTVDVEVGLKNTANDTGSTTDYINGTGQYARNSGEYRTIAFTADTNSNNISGNCGHPLNFYTLGRMNSAGSTFTNVNDGNALFTNDDVDVETEGIGKTKLKVYNMDNNTNMYVSLGQTNSTGYVSISEDTTCLITTSTLNGSTVLAANDVVHVKLSYRIQSEDDVFGDLDQFLWISHDDDDYKENEISVSGSSEVDSLGTTDANQMIWLSGKTSEEDHFYPISKIGDSTSVIEVEIPLEGALTGSASDIEFRLIAKTYYKNPDGGIEEAIVDAASAHNYLIGAQYCKFDVA